MTSYRVFWMNTEIDTIINVQLKAVVKILKCTLQTAFPENGFTLLSTNGSCQLEDVPRSQHVEHHQGCRQHCFILNLRLWLHQWRTDQMIFMVQACLALIGLQAQTEQFYWKQNLSHITSYNPFSCSLRVHTLPVLCLAWENFNLCINRFNDYVTQWVSCPTLSFEPLAWLHITCIRTAILINPA